MLGAHVASAQEDGGGRDVGRETVTRQHVVARHHVAAARHHSVAKEAGGLCGQGSDGGNNSTCRTHNAIT